MARPQPVAEARPAQRLAWSWLCLVAAGALLVPAAGPERQALFRSNAERLLAWALSAGCAAGAGLPSAAWVAVRGPGAARRTAGAATAALLLAVAAAAAGLLSRSGWGFLWWGDPGTLRLVCGELP